MREKLLPKPYPRSVAGLVSLGMCFVACLAKYFLSLNWFFIIFLISFILFISSACIYFNFRKPLFATIRWFVLGCFLFALFRLVVVVENVDKTKRIPSEITTQFAKQVHTLLVRSPFPKEMIGVSLGLVLGKTQYLTKDFKERTREGGILHLFAASGLHLGIFIGSFIFLLKQFFKEYRIIVYLVPLLFAYFYLLVLGFPVSFVRAYSFAVYTLLGKLFYRKSYPGDVLAYSSVTIVVFLPHDFLSPGFLLSFGAVFGIFYIKPALDGMFFPKQNHFLKENLTLSMACSLATFPTLALIFHSFSYGSLWINLIVVPVASILLPLLYLNLFLEWMIGGILIRYLWAITDIFLRFFLFLVSKCTDLFSFFYSWENPPKLLFVYFLLISLLIVFIYLCDCNRKLKGFIFFLILSFQPLGIYYFDSISKRQTSSMSWIYKGNAFFLSDSKFIATGFCYAERNFAKIISKIQIKKINQIILENESCLPYAISLQKRIQRMEGRIAELKIIDGSKDLLSIPKMGGGKNEIWIRYNGDKRKLFQLLNTLKGLERNFPTRTLQASQNSPGLLILDFPSWSKEKVEDWKKYQKLLGISSKWKIVSTGELLASQIHNTD